MVDIRNGQTVAFLRFEDAVHEIFAVKALPGIRFPEMLEWSDPLLRTTYVLPDEALALVPQAEAALADELPAQEPVKG